MPVLAAPRRRSLLLLLALVAGTALALELGWIAAFRWAASSGRLEAWLNRRPERVSVRFERARSYWPGLIELDGLLVRGRTARVEWQVEAERVRGQLALVPLLARTASFRAIAGEGIAVRTLRRREEGPARGAPRAMASLPLPGAERAERPQPPHPSPRWTLAFRNLRLERIREIHLDTTRFTGEARGEGGFAIDTASATAEILASRLEIARGEIEHEGQPFGRDLAGRIELAVRPWPYRQLRDRRQLALVGGRIVLSGAIDDRRLLGELLRRAPWARVEPAVAPFEVDLRLRQGRLLPGSRLASPAVPRRIRLMDYEVAGPAGFALEVAEGEDGLEARWAANFLDFAMTLGGEGPPLLTGRGLALTGRAPDPVVAEIAERTELALELGEAELPDLARFSSWLPGSSGLELAGGSARVGGRLAVRLADRKPHGRLTAVFDRARLRWSGAELAGRIEVEVPVVDGDVDQRRLDVSGAKLRLERFAAPALAAAGGPPADGWWANVHLPIARMRLAPPVEVEGEFEARLRDTVPIVGLFELKRDLPGWAERTLSVENVEVTGRIHGAPRAFALDDLESPLYGGVLSAWARFDEKRKRGKALLSWRRLAVGVGFDGEARELRLVHAKEWFAERETGPSAPE